MIFGLKKGGGVVVAQLWVGEDAIKWEGGIFKQEGDRIRFMFYDMYRNGVEAGSNGKYWLRVHKLRYSCINWVRKMKAWSKALGWDWQERKRPEMLQASLTDLDAGCKTTIFVEFFSIFIVFEYPLVFYCLPVRPKCNGGVTHPVIYICLFLVRLYWHFYDKFFRQDTKPFFFLTT